MERPKGWTETRTGRAPMRSPGRPQVNQRQTKQPFWERIAAARLPRQPRVYGAGRFHGRAPRDHTVRLVQGVRTAQATASCLDSSRRRAMIKIRGRGSYAPLVARTVLLLVGQDYEQSCATANMA